jgi:hypothetical protein
MSGSAVLPARAQSSLPTVKAAKALNLDIPVKVLAVANEVME